MSTKIIISDLAKTEIQNALTWYENQNIILRSKLESSINTAIKDIETTPLADQLKYKWIRVYYLRRFPFGIHFTISSSAIIIIA